MAIKRKSTSTRRRTKTLSRRRSPKLTAAKRRALPRSKFAIPARAGSRTARGLKKSGRYPIDTPNRARNALARVSAHGTPAEKRRVAAAVRRRYPQLGKSAFVKKHTSRRR